MCIYGEHPASTGLQTLLVTDEEYEHCSSVYISLWSRQRCLIWHSLYEEALDYLRSYIPFQPSSFFKSFSIALKYSGQLIEAIQQAWSAFCASETSGSRMLQDYLAAEMSRIAFSCPAWLQFQGVSYIYALSAPEVHTKILLLHRTIR